MQRPDRIIIGEVRGGECFDMLQAMNTGHGGMLCTWEISASVHLDRVRIRLPAFSEHAWHHKPWPYPAGDFANFFHQLRQVGQFREIAHAKGVNPLVHPQLDVTQSQAFGHGRSSIVIETGFQHDPWRGVAYGAAVSPPCDWANFRRRLIIDRTPLLRERLKCCFRSRRSNRPNIFS